jgi:hypothetical protein
MSAYQPAAANPSSGSSRPGSKLSNGSWPGGQLVEVDEDDELRWLPEEDEAPAQVGDLVGRREPGVGQEVEKACLGVVVAIELGHPASLVASALRGACAV